MFDFFKLPFRVFMVVCALSSVAFPQTSQGPTLIPQLNRDYFVGQVNGFYPTVQSAVTATCAISSGAGSLGSRVIVAAGSPADGTSGFTISAVTGGCPKVPIIDQRAQPATTCSWGGSSYACSSGGGSASIAHTSNVIKGDGTGNGLAATPGTDYVVPSGSISGTAAGLSGASSLPNGTTATTQTTGDNSTKIATDAFVLANAGAGGGGLAGQTAGYAVEAATATTATGPFPMDDGITTTGVVTVHKPMQVVGGTAHGVSFPASSTPITPVAATAIYESDSSGNAAISENGAAASRPCTVANALCASTGGIQPAPSGAQAVVQPVVSSAQTFLSVNDLNAANTTYQSAQIYGDSISQGTGATTYMQPGVRGQPTTWVGNSDVATTTYSNGPTAYAYLLQADFGNAANNYGRGGDASTDMAWHNAIWAHPTLQNNPVRTAMVGTNDNSFCGTTTNCQDTTIKAELFSAANSTIPDTLKAFASSCTMTGTWTADANLPGAMYATTSGATMSCTFKSSTAFAYVAYEKCDNTGNTAAGTLTVNGSAGTLEPTISFFGLGGSSIFFTNGASYATGTGLFTHCTLALARNAGVAGSNTVLFTSTNSTRTEIFWMGGPYVAPATAIAPPVYVAGGVPYEAAGAGEPGAGQYNTIASNVVTTLAGDGNNVLFANVRGYMNSTTDFTGGTQATGDAVCGVNSPNGSPWAATTLTPLHPGDGGHCHIYEAFHAVLNPQPRQSQALSIYAGAYGLITGANSLNGKYGADGGNTGGASPSSLLDFSNTGYGSTVGTDYAVPGFDPLQLRYNASNQATSALSGVYGLFDPTTQIYRWMASPDGTAFCANVPVASLAACAGGTNSFYGATKSVIALGTTSASSPVVGFQLNAVGVNAFQYQFWGTGNGFGLAGAGGLWDNTNTHFVWSTNSTDDLYGYTPLTNVSTGIGSTWSILHTGAAAFSTVGALNSVASGTSTITSTATGAGGGANFNVIASSASQAVGAYDFTVTGVNNFTLAAWGTGTGFGLASALGLFDNTNNRFVWNTNSSDDFCGYTPVTAVSTCSGSPWTILHTGIGTFTTVVTPALLPGTIFSGAGTALPACVVALKGERAVVSDATTPTYMGAYTSGGAITTEVICSYNGTTYSWLTH